MNAELARQVNSEKGPVFLGHRRWHLSRHKGPGAGAAMATGFARCGGRKTARSPENSHQKGAVLACFKAGEIHLKSISGVPQIDWFMATLAAARSEAKELLTRQFRHVTSCHCGQ